MSSQRWRPQPSFRRHLRTMIHGGVHRTRKLFTYGTQWTIKIDSRKLKTTSEWTIWKTREKEWSPALGKAGFHQLLNTMIHKGKRAECWGFKIKGWWRKGDIRTTKPRKTFKCWVKTTSDVPTGAQKSLTEALTAPQHNVGKDAYIVDLESDEKLYWLDTESGLLGVFDFEGA